MFGIYCISIYSLGPQECRDKFNQDREVLLRRYHSGAREALRRAGFLKSSDLIVLQAFVLYLVSSLSDSKGLHTY